MQRKVSIGIVAIVVAAAVGLAGWAWDQSRQALTQAVAAATAQAEAMTQRGAAQATQATAVANQGRAEAAAATAASEAQARATEAAAAAQGQAAAEQRYQAALAQKLGAQAQLRLDDTADPTLGGLLAVESLSRYPNLEGDVAARRGIELLAWRGIFTATTQEACVRSMSPSLNSRRLATLSTNCRYEDRDVEVKVWDVDAGRELFKFIPGPDEPPAVSVDLSLDGNWLVISNQQHGIKVVAVDTGQPIVQTVTPGWAFSPSGLEVAVIGDGNTISIWYLPEARLQLQLTQNEIVTDVIFSLQCGNPPEAQCTYWLAARGEDKIWLWDINSGKLAREITYRAAEIRFSPDGRWLIMRGEDRVGLWDVAAGKLAHEIAYRSGGLRLNRSRSWLALIGRGDRTVRVWEMGTWREVSQATYEASDYFAVEFSPAGQWLAILDSGGTVQVRETSSGKIVTRISLGANGTSSLAFNGRWLVTSAEGGMIQVWETGTWRESARMAYGASWVMFSADGWRLVSNSPSDGVHVWEERLGMEAAKIVALQPVLAFGPKCDGSPAAKAERCGRWLASIQINRMENGSLISVLDMSTGQEVAQLKAVDAWLTSFVFGPEGRITAGDDAGTLHSWDVASGREISRTVLGEAAKIVLAFSPDGRWMVSAANNNAVVKMWDVAAGREVASADVQNFPTPDMRATFSPDSRWAAITTYKSILLWDVNAPHDLIYLADDVLIWPGLSWVAAFSPDSRLLAANGGRVRTNGGDTNLVRVWDVATRQGVACLPHRYAISDIAFSLDGHSLVVGSGEVSSDWKALGEIRVWDAATWRAAVAIDSGAVGSLSLSSDGRWIAAGAARVWEASTGREVARISDKGAYRRPLFSPECDSPPGATAERCGRWLVTVGDDHFSVWAWQPADMIAQACARLTRNLTRAEWRLYLGDEPYRATCPALPVAEE